jgi:glycosyltransferase involved in cell wall biosynthesis
MSHAVQRIGVIVTTHGDAVHLPAALDSVRGQTFAGWRLAVVCDGAAASALATARTFAARDPRISVVEQARAGVAAARNRGLDALDGQNGTTDDAIAFLDHDDRWLPDTLARLAAVLSRAGAGIMGAHGLGRFIDAGGAPLRPGELEGHLRRRLGVDGDQLRPWPTDRPTEFANLVFSNCIPVGSVLVRRAALDRAGRFDPRAVPADDYDMWLRLARLGDFAFLDEVVMEYRRGDGPTWPRPRGGAAFVRRKLLASPDNSPLQARLARRGYRFNERWTVTGALVDGSALLRRGDLYGAARKLARAAVHAAAWARGAPVGRGD